jgi:F0F1-type ATP synthase gamma subunit
VRLVLIGKKLNDYFRRRSYPVLQMYPDLPDQARIRSGAAADAPGDRLVQERRGRRGGSRLLAIRERDDAQHGAVPFLPIGAGVTTGVARDYIFEPNAAELVDRLLAAVCHDRMLQAFAESYASEHSARACSRWARRARMRVSSSTDWS